MKKWPTNPFKAFENLQREFFFSYLHKIEERGFVVKYIGEFNIAARQYVNLMLTVKVASQKVIDVSIKSKYVQFGLRLSLRNLKSMQF